MHICNISRYNVFSSHPIITDSRRLPAAAEDSDFKGTIAEKRFAFGPTAS